MRLLLASLVVGGIAATAFGLAIYYTNRGWH